MHADGHTRYVADTHALLWHLFEPWRVSRAAEAAFELVRAGWAELWVPAIVFAELDYACRKRRLPRSVGLLIEQAQAGPNIRLAPLAGETLSRFLDLDEPPEMHDRMVAAEALRLKAPVITRDPALRALPYLETIW